MLFLIFNEGGRGKNKHRRKKTQGGAGGLELGAVGLNGLELGAVGLNGLELGAVGLNGLELGAVGLNGLELGAVGLNGLELGAVGLNGLELLAKFAACFSQMLLVPKSNEVYCSLQVGWKNASCKA